MTIRSPSELRATMAVAELHHAVEIGLDEGLIRDLRRAADVEGAHGELRARLADRLRRDDADRLAHVDGRAARQIAPVAFAAQTPFLASQVSTERIFTSWMPAALMRSICHS